MPYRVTFTRDVAAGPAGSIIDHIKLRIPVAESGTGIRIANRTVPPGARRETLAQDSKYVADSTPSDSRNAGHVVGSKVSGSVPALVRATT